MRQMKCTQRSLVRIIPSLGSHTFDICRLSAVQMVEPIEFGARLADRQQTARSSLCVRVRLYRLAWFLLSISGRVKLARYNSSNVNEPNPASILAGYLGEIAQTR